MSAFNKWKNSSQSAAARDAFFWLGCPFCKIAADGVHCCDCELASVRASTPSFHLFLSFQVGVVMLSILCHVWKVVPDLYEAIINMNRDNECGHEEEVICNIISSTCAQQRTGECHQVQGSAEKWLIGCVKRAPAGRGNHAT